MSKAHGTITSTTEHTGTQNLFRCYTLIDITKTGIVSKFRGEIPMFVDDADQIVKSEKDWNRSRNQQRNLETIIQIISLRAQPIYLEASKIEVVLLSDYNFGSGYVGKQNVWSFKFSVEHSNVFGPDAEALHTDLNNIPCISGLKETVKLPINMFETFGNNINTYFKFL